jgi:tRNA1(Val) A37 N6-methylase TrmN6
LAHKGRLFTIYPAARLTDILLHLRQAGLEPKQIRAIHFKSDTPAQRIIIQAVKQGQPGLEMAPPLFIHAPNGAYTPEAQTIINPDTYGHGSSPAC